MFKRLSRQDAAFNVVSFVILTLVFLSIAYPLYFVLIASVSDPVAVASGNVWLWPKGLTLDGYARVFADSRIMRGYMNSVLYTLAGIAVDVAVTLPAAYSMSRRDLVGRNGFMVFFMIITFISGGLVPTFLVVKSLHLYNTMWALILPGAINIYFMIIARTFFQSSIPFELWEAANMDGCSNARFFMGVVLPLSKAIVAILVLYYGVGHWNSYFSAMIYLNDTKKYPLQLILRDILVQNQLNYSMIKDQDLLAQRQNLSEMIKYALIIVSSVPVLCLYPFLQKYFIKGVLIGSLKG